MNDEFDISKIEELSEVPEESSVLAFSSYVRKNTLRRRDGKLWGNWGSSFAAACVHPQSNKYIYEGSIIGKPRKIGNCGSGGYEIWMFEHN